MLAPFETMLGGTIELTKDTGGLVSSAFMARSPRSTQPAKRPRRDVGGARAIAQECSEHLVLARVKQRTYASKWDRFRRRIDRNAQLGDWVWVESRELERRREVLESQEEADARTLAARKLREAAVSRTREIAAAKQRAILDLASGSGRDFSFEELRRIHDEAHDAPEIAEIEAKLDSDLDAIGMLNFPSRAKPQPIMPGTLVVDSDGSMSRVAANGWTLIPEEIDTEDVPRIIVSGEAFSNLVREKALELVTERGIAESLARALIEKAAQELASYRDRGLPAWTQWKARHPLVVASPPPEPEVPTLEEALKFVEEKALSEVWLEAHAWVVKNKPEAVRQYDRETARMWREPDVIMRALIENPYALAYIAVTKDPTERKPGDPHPDRGSHDALWRAIERTLGPSVKDALRRHRAALACEFDPERRRGLVEAFKAEMGAVFETAEWRRWDRLRKQLSELEATMSVPQFADYKLRRLVPAFNALGLGVRMCVNCGALFGVVDGRTRKSISCSDCADTVRQKNWREERAARSVEDLQAAVDRAMEDAKQHVPACAAVPPCSPRALCPRGRQLAQQVDNAQRALEAAQASSAGDLVRRGTRVKGSYAGEYKLGRSALRRSPRKKPAE